MALSGMSSRRLKPPSSLTAQVHGILDILIVFLLTGFEVASNVGWKALFSSVGNRKRMRIIVALAFFSQWSGNGLVSYYLTDVLDTIGITDPTIQVSI
jgi:Sugar (and other) transporter